MLKLDASVSGRRIILILTICSFSLQIRRACPQPHQRCIGQTLGASQLRRNESVFHLAKNTTCEACPASVVQATLEGESTEKSNATRILFLLQYASSEVLAILAGLLTEALRVTIIILDPDLSANALRRDVISRVSCHKMHKSNETLRITNLNSTVRFDRDCWQRSAPLEKCTLDHAEYHYRLIDEYLKRDRQNIPDVIMMDPITTSGMLVSETWLIPAVVLPTYNLLWLAVFLERMWEDEQWSVVYSTRHMFRQRLHGFSLTGPFLNLNTIRRNVGLTPLKTPANYFDSTMFVVILFGPESYPRHLGNVFLSGPVVPPCIACNSEQPRILHSNGIILVAPSPDLGPAHTRALIRSLAISRKALEEYDDCEWDSLSCINAALGFHVVWMSETNASLPAVLPSFLTIENSTSLLDAYARHENTIAILAHCNSESEFLSSLGTPVMCISQDAKLPPKPELLLSDDEVSDPRATATKVLQALRYSSSPKRRFTDNATISKLDSVPTIVYLTTLAAKVKRNHHHWKKAQDMKDSISLLLDSSSDEGQQYDTVTVLIAWLALVTSGSYIALKDPLLTRWRPRRGHRESVEGLLSRLSDLDDAYIIFMTWFEFQPARRRYKRKMEEVQRNTQESDVQGADHKHGHRNHHHNHHGQHHLRRRRKR